MSQPFYKYLVEDLLVSYFKQNPAPKGSKYFIILENLDACQELKDAFLKSSFCTQIDIDTRVFENPSEDLPMTSYKTGLFSPSEDGAKLILGDTNTATDDYLTTLRNSVEPSSFYEDYGTLFILSTVRTESLTTAAIDLMSPHMPLHIDEVLKSIQERIDETSLLTFEKMILLDYISRIKEEYFGLFEFEEVLSVLKDKSLEDYYSKLGYFKHQDLKDAKTLKKETADIIRLNAEVFKELKRIFTTVEESSRKAELLKILDVKLTDELLKAEKWEDTDFGKILKSINEHNATAEYKFIDFEITQASYLKKEKGSAKRRQFYIILCDTTDSDHTPVRLRFNKAVKDVCYVTEPGIKQLSSEYDVIGSRINLKVRDNFLKVEVGEPNNNFVFWFLRIKADSGVFYDISSRFRLNTKGAIEVFVPEDMDRITIGKGEKHIDLHANDKYDEPWTNDISLHVIFDEEDDEEVRVIPVTFENRTVTFRFIVNRASIVPLKPHSLFERIWTTQKSFQNSGPDEDRYSKVSNGEEEFSIDRQFRKYFLIEDQMVDTACLYVKTEQDSITHQIKYVPGDSLQIPPSVKDACDAIFQYFKARKTIPSLSFIDDDLRVLYVNYLDRIKEAISSVAQGSLMGLDVYNLSKIGTVIDDSTEKIWFTPFHPVLVSFMLEFKRLFDEKELQNPKVLKLVNPLYLIPYIKFNGTFMQPFCDNITEEFKAWLCYEKAKRDQQIHTYNVATKMVRERMHDFILHFNYLFQDKENPIIVNTIGIYDDTHIVEGIIKFIIDEYLEDGRPQRIELHEYVRSITEETFFERLNRLNSDEKIAREFDQLNLDIRNDAKYSIQEVIRQLFTRVSFYKHELTAHHEQVGYCHVAFYQMETGLDFGTPPSNGLRNELSLCGLISIPSTINQDGAKYTIGYGSKGIEFHLLPEDSLYRYIGPLNTLYANDTNNAFNANVSVAKSYVFKENNLLQSIYSNARWVTFLNPEVDLNFFYKQDLYIVHYTDQYTINAKYDAITVTKHLEQYNNLLSIYDGVIKGKEEQKRFRETMMGYFNSLNGEWLLRVMNSTEDVMREKMSIVAASVLMTAFMKRIPGVIWVPISLEEILRVTGSIGLEQDSLFSKKTLGIKGSTSDDLLMLGAEEIEGKVKFYFYPVEVKVSNSTSFKSKADSQVTQTYQIFENTLLGEETFTNKVYRTFFASQYLTAADKLKANGLLGQKEYDVIEKLRFELLNLQFSVEKELPCSDIGKAGVVSFFGDTGLTLYVENIEDLPVCHIELAKENCFDFVSKPSYTIEEDLRSRVIDVQKPSGEDLTTEISQGEPLPIEDSSSNGPLPVLDQVSDTPKSSSNETANGDAENVTKITDDSLGIRINVGTTKYNKKLITFIPNDTIKVSHPNMGIIGTMGTGKTQFARSVIAQISKEAHHNVGGKPVGVLVFDYKGDYKDASFLSVVNGECYRSGYPFNPLKLIVSEDVEGMNLPAITADRISDSFAKAYGLGPVQQNSIKQIIIETYSDKGITRDPSTWSLTPPTIDHVIEKYFEKYDSNDKAYALFSKLQDYTIFTTDTSRCVSLFEWLNGVKVIDLTLFPDDTKRVIVSLILDLFYEEMKLQGNSQISGKYRELRSIIMVDEAHQFLKKDFNSLRRIISEGRMFGVGMILSTQNVSDFKSANEDYSQFILSWIIHHVNSINKTELSSIFGASDPNFVNYMDFISKAGQFESLCKLGKDVNTIRDIPFFELITNDDRFSPAE